MHEWILEIETKKTIKKVKEPRKVRKKDLLFFYKIQVMGDDGKWQNIANIDTIPYWTSDEAVEKIKKAIRSKQTYVNIE